MEQLLRNQLHVQAIANLLMLFAIGFASGIPVQAADRYIVLQSTTSTENSGLFSYLLPLFTAKTGIKVHSVVGGTGQAISNARNGDGDVLFVHSKPDEDAFVAAGFGVKRYDVMHNDFIIVGPQDDPAKIAGMRDASGALKAIALSRALFASRGDESGTHKAEMRLWRDTGIDPILASGDWYRETGSGMGATLNTGSGLNAYVLTDRATWSAFRNRGSLKLLVEGDARLFNQYGVTLVNPKRFPNVKAADGQQFIDWLISPEGQSAIAAFRIEGRQQFFPNARAPED